MLRIGTISEGTLRPEDLLEALGSALEEVATSGNHRSLAKDARHMAWELESDDWPDPDQAAIDDTLQHLYESLEYYAPALTYVGAIEGDGACIGVWPDMNAFEDCVNDGEILKVSDLNEVPDPPINYEAVAVVNDHGNVTLWAMTPDGLKEQWAVV